MKRIAYLFSALIIILFIFLALNISVSTNQCIDFKCSVYSLPLYLKTLDFFDRHYNYMFLIKTITNGEREPEARTMKIFAWVQNRIRRNPKELPVVDDHVWHIIVRGYGVSDQFQDVFTTLCNYSGIDAFFYCIKSEGNAKSDPLSFVKLNNKWTVFDAYNGVYFNNLEGKLADIDDLYSGRWQGVSIAKTPLPESYANYQKWFKYIHSVPYQAHTSSRPALQSPLRRFTYWLQKKR